jgi:Protein of unknown function (DUF3168)
MIETGIVAELLADAATIALVKDRIEPSKVDQGEGYPQVWMERRSTDRQRTLLGPTGLVRAEVDLVCDATTRADATAVIKAIRERLIGTRTNPATFPARWGASANGPGIRVQSAHLSDDVDGWTAPVGADDVGVFHTGAVLEVWFEEN